MDTNSVSRGGSVSAEVNDTTTELPALHVSSSGSHTPWTETQRKNEGTYHTIESTSKSSTSNDAMHQSSSVRTKTATFAQDSSTDRTVGGIDDAALRRPMRTAQNTNVRLTPAVTKDTSTANKSQQPSSSAAPDNLTAALMGHLGHTSTKTALTYYYNQYKQSEADKEALCAEMHTRDEDAMHVIDELQSKLSHILHDAAHYRSEVTSLLESRAAAEQELHAHYHALLHERDAQLHEYFRLTSHLQDDVRQASAHAKQHQDHVRELQVLRSQMREQAEAHQRELSALRFQTVDGKVKLLALESTMKSSFDSHVSQESNRLLALRHGELLQRNATLEAERVRMMREVDALVRVTDRMHAERVTMQRSAELQAQTHHGVLHRLVWGNRQSREMDRQLQHCEAQLRACREQQRTLRLRLQDEYEGKMHALRQELTAVQTSLHVHRRELAKMRALAATVVSQRSELERFFYAALQDCRRYRAGLRTTQQCSVTSTALASGTVMTSGIPRTGAKERKARSTKSPMQCRDRTVTPAAGKNNRDTCIVGSATSTRRNEHGVALGGLPHRATQSSSVALSECQREVDDDRTSVSGRVRRTVQSRGTNASAPSSSFSSPVYVATPTVPTDDMTVSPSDVALYSREDASAAQGTAKETPPCSGHSKKTTCCKLDSINTNASSLVATKAQSADRRPSRTVNVGEVESQPTLAGGGGGGDATRHAYGRQAAPDIRFEELSWEDKERVIRALFVFINSNYLAHTRARYADEDSVAMANQNIS